MVISGFRMGSCCTATEHTHTHENTRSKIKCKTQTGVCGFTLIKKNEKKRTTKIVCVYSRGREMNKIINMLLIFCHQLC